MKPPVAEFSATGVHYSAPFPARLLGHFGFTHVGRSFDAVQYVHNTKGEQLLLLLAGGRPKVCFNSAV